MKIVIRRRKNEKDEVKMITTKGTIFVDVGRVTWVMLLYILMQRLNMKVYSQKGLLHYIRKSKVDQKKMNGVQQR